MTSWQTIDTAPKDGTVMLVYCPWIKKVCLGRIGHPSSRHKDKWAIQFGVGTSGFVEGAPSHWQNLPEPPHE